MEYWNKKTRVFVPNEDESGPTRATNGPTRPHWTKKVQRSARLVLIWDRITGDMGRLYSISLRKE